MPPWDENAPAIPGTQIPTLGNIGGPSAAYQNMVRQMALWQQMQDYKLNRAGSTPARVGVAAQAPQAPYAGGQAPGGNVTLGGPIPGSTPSTPGAGGSAFQATPRQASEATQMPYYQGGAKGGTAANAIIGVGNLIARQRQQDQQEEYQQAEGLWTQILNAQANMQKAAEQGLDDPYDQEVIQRLLKDKKNQKIIQDTYGNILSTVPGGDQQQQQDPTKAAQVSGAKGALQKFERSKFGQVAGRVLGGFDPRTAAQKMPSTPGPGVNQPGGVNWQFPQPTQEQIAMRQAREQTMTPENLAQKMRQDMGLELTAQQKATQQRYEDQIEMNRQYHQGLIDMNAQRYQDIVDERKHRDELEHQDRQARIKAAAQKNQVDKDALDSLVQKFMSGQLNKNDLSKIGDKNMRSAVEAAMKGHPFANPITARQQDNLQLLNQSSRIIPDAYANLDKLEKDFPELKNAATSQWQNVKGVVANRLRYGAYQGGAYVDPMWTRYYEFAGTVEARGLAPFLQVARNRNMMDVAMIHVPKPTDTPEQIRQKLEWFDRYIVKDSINEIDATRWGTNIHPYSGDLPTPGGAPSPTGGGGAPVIVTPEDLDATVPR